MSCWQWVVSYLNSLLLTTFRLVVLLSREKDMLIMYLSI